MPLQEAFRVFASTTQIRVITPPFLFKLPFFKRSPSYSSLLEVADDLGVYSRLREIQAAYDAVEEFINSNIEQRKKEAKLEAAMDEPDNVFSRLVLASEKEKGVGSGLDDSELVCGDSPYGRSTLTRTLPKRGSVFAMLFAGHGRYFSVAA